MNDGSAQPLLGYGTYKVGHHGRATVTPLIYAICFGTRRGIPSSAGLMRAAKPLTLTFVARGLIRLGLSRPPRRLLTLTPRLGSAK